MPDDSSSREWSSTAYHRLSQPQVGWGKKLLVQLELCGDEVLLDAGCGTGRLTAELLELVPRGRVVAADLSLNMLRTAREYLAPQFGERVCFVAADLQDLPFEHAFDGIFSTAAFHWVPDHNRLFGSLYRALRPGGWLRAQCGGQGNLARLLQRVTALATTPPYAPFLGGYKGPWVFADPETAAERLRRAGFVEIETGLESAQTVLQDAEHYCEYLANVTLHRHLARIPDARLRRQFLQEIAQQAANDAPPFCMDYWRLNLRARVP